MKINITRFFRTRAFIFLTTIFLFSSGNSYAEENKAEQEVYAQFESICLSFVNDYSRSLPVVESLGYKQLDTDIAQKLLYPQTGKAWFMEGEFSKTILMISDSGSCSISSPKNVSGTAVLEIFTQKTNPTLQSKENLGSQEQYFFKVSFPDALGQDDGKAIVMITLSTLSNYSDSIILNSVSEQSFQEQKQIEE
ncbi:MAG: hypothetical protein KJ017_09130 [Alphaproteobacteria bacterium]|nr:hypothetical protein [Alphaproteobacteria bacterium]